VRWVPAESTCAECQFRWDVDLAQATALVAELPDRLPGTGIAHSVATTPAGWSARGYLWHLVDVLQIGAERLRTLALDPGNGLPCWDENALAAVRQYERLSVPVGMQTLSVAVREWAAAATTTPPTAVADHPEFGQLTAADVIRRCAHEAVHHALDIARLLGRDADSP
jgi:hypothetical protein